MNDFQIWRTISQIEWSSDLDIQRRKLSSFSHIIKVAMSSDWPLCKMEANPVFRLSSLNTNISHRHWNCSSLVEEKQEREGEEEEEEGVGSLHSDDLVRHSTPDQEIKDADISINSESSKMLWSSPAPQRKYVYCIFFKFFTGFSVSGIKNPNCSCRIQLQLRHAQNCSHKLKSVFWFLIKRCVVYWCCYWLAVSTFRFFVEI